MAKRRILSVDYLDSDNFNTMPNSAKMLYIYLNMHADDEGFCSGGRLAMALADATSEDMKMLQERKHIIIFESGAICIKHWQKHNQIKNDRLQKTDFAKEREQLVIVNGVYQWKQDVDKILPKVEEKTSKTYPKMEENWTQNGDKMSAQVKLSKDKISKDIKEEVFEEESGQQVSTPTPEKTTRFIPPSQQDVENYIAEHGYHVDAERFILFYSSKGWMVGKNKMKDWKAAVQTWEKKWKEDHPAQQEVKAKPQLTGNHSFDADEFFELAVASTRRKAGLQ